MVLLPGGRWNNKRWPAPNFVTVVKGLEEISDLRFVILGSKDERALGETIAAAAPRRALNLSGATTLDEMIEWIRLSALTITNDTGPMHAAAAMNRPVLALFGPTNLWNTGPYRQLANVLQETRLPCVPCQKSRCAYDEPLACLHRITPKAVLERDRQMLLAGKRPLETTKPFMWNST